MGYFRTGKPGWRGRIATGALCPGNSVVRELANLSLVKRLLSRSEESRIRQLPFPVLPIIFRGSESWSRKRYRRRQGWSFLSIYGTSTNMRRGLTSVRGVILLPFPRGPMNNLCGSSPPLPGTLSVWRSGWAPAVSPPLRWNPPVFTGYPSLRC